MENNPYKNWKMPNVKVGKKGKHHALFIDHYSSLDYIRLKHLARKQKRNIHGLFIQALLKYIKSRHEQN